MMKQKRMITLILAMLMAVGVMLTAVSCGTPSDDPSTETKDHAVTTVAPETETLPPYDALDKENFDRTFAILCRSEMLDQFFVEGLTGDLLDDMIYTRNATIENDFGIAFEFYDVSEAEVNNSMQMQVTSGLDDYDMYSGHLSSLAACAQNNYCYDLNQIKALDLDGAWWDQACRENLTVGGKTYVMTGDIDPQSMLISACFVYNKRITKELGKSVEELNELADNGKWTLDVLYEYGKEATLDLNGDGSLKFTDDRFNITSWMYDVPYSLFYGAGGKYVSIVDDTPELSYSTEKIIDTYEKIYDVLIEQNSCYVTDFGQYGLCYSIFREGRAMFIDLTLNKITIEVADQMDDPYGILPVPKYDENQEEYLSFVNGYTPLAMVAKTESDPEFVGAIMEAMATYNYDKVTPQLFEVSTKLQAAQDPTSAAMVDYIVRNRIYDLGYFYGWPISGLIQNNLAKKQEEIASQLESLRGASEKALAEMIEAYGKHQ